MTLVADLAVPYIRLTLDTRAPRLAVTAASRMGPPGPWLVAVTADEDLADASLVLTDSLGTEHSVGPVWASTRVLSALVPTVGLPTGPAVLTGWAEDTAGNRTAVIREVVIDRPLPWDAVLTIERAWEASMALADGYDATLTFGHGLDATEEHTPAWDADLIMERGWDARVEQTNGG